MARPGVQGIQFPELRILGVLSLHRGPHNQDKGDPCRVGPQPIPTGQSHGLTTEERGAELRQGEGKRRKERGVG